MFINKDSIMVKYVGTTGNPSALGLYESNNNAFVPTSDTSFNGSKSYYVSLGQYLLEVHFEFNKLWADDSGRNLAGVMSGTLVGIFPKLVCQFRHLNKDELEVLIPILDSRTQTLTYYDPNKKTNVTMQTYTGDYTIINKKIISGARTNEGFEISFISVRKRS